MSTISDSGYTSEQLILEIQTILATLSVQLGRCTEQTLGQNLQLQRALMSGLRMFQLMSLVLQAAENQDTQSESDPLFPRTPRPRTATPDPDRTDS